MNLHSGRGRSAPHAALSSYYCGVARSRGNYYSVDGRIRQIRALVGSGSTTLRQVLRKFSEFSFVGLAQRNFAPGSPSSDDRHLGRGSGVEIGLLIQTSLGRAGGLGALGTKRSG